MKRHYLLGNSFAIAMLMGASLTVSATDISDEAGLRAIANDLAGEYTLTADITLTSDWTPLGSENSPFTGKIHGNGHVIKNVKAQDKDTDRMGFISVAQGATIEKLGLENVDILGSADTGGLVGQDRGSTISECYVTGYIAGRDHVGSLIGGCKDNGMTVVTNCYGIAYVYSREHQAAGLVGTPVDLQLDKCYFAGTVCGNQNCMGGLAALIDGGNTCDISNSFVAAPMLVRENTGYGAQDRILGNTNGKSNKLTNLYALAGTELGEYGKFEVKTDNNPNWTTGADKTYAELTSPEFIKTTLTWDTDNVWVAEDGVLPRLKWQKAPVDASVVCAIHAGTSFTIAQGSEVYAKPGVLYGAKIVSANPEVAVYNAETGKIEAKSNGKTTITISWGGDATVAASSAIYNVEVKGVAYTINTVDDLKTVSMDLAGKFTLNADLDLSGENWAPLGTNSDPFTGTFDGNGHVIKNLTYNSSEADKIGLFGVAQGATIKNLGLENVNIYAHNDVAGLLGFEKGSCTISGCYVTGKISGRDHVGALLGGGDEGTVTNITDSYAVAYVYSRDSQAGGLVGITKDVTIDRCYFAGHVYDDHDCIGGILSLVDGGSSTVIKNSFVAAPYVVSPDAWHGKGRILGLAKDGATTLENNYALADMKVGKFGEFATANDNTAGNDGASKNYAELTSPEFIKTTLGWDTENVWVAAAGVLPHLAWQKAAIDASAVYENYTEPKDITVGTKAESQITVATLYGATYTSAKPSIATVSENGVVTGVSAGQTTVAVAWGGDATVAAASKDINVNVEGVYYTITSADQLKSIRLDLAGEFTLDADIDMEGADVWTPIGTEAAPFTGKILGNGHKIKNIKISGENNVGFIGTAHNATVSHLGMEGATVNYTGNGANVAVIVGRANGGVEVRECYVEGCNIRGRDHVAAIVGGSFKNGDKANLVEDCHVTDTKVFTNEHQVAGIMGTMINATINRCYFTGDVNPESKGTNAGGMVSLIDAQGDGITNAITNCVCLATYVKGNTTGRILGNAGNRQVTLTNNYAVETTECNGSDSDNTTSGRQGETVSAAEAESADFYKTKLGWPIHVLSQPASYRVADTSRNAWYTGNMGKTTKYPELTVFATFDTTGIDEVSTEGTSTVSVLGVPGGVAVTASEAAVVSVYTTAGALVAQTPVEGSAVVPAAAGIYVVSVATEGAAKTYKVVVM